MQRIELRDSFGDYLTYLEADVVPRMGETIKLWYDNHHCAAKVSKVTYQTTLVDDHTCTTGDVIIHLTDLRAMMGGR